jgi:protoheme IX farnesyltransferase
MRFTTLTTIYRLQSVRIHSTLRWSQLPEFSFNSYPQLAKAKLSSFVILTTMAGYAMAPVALNLSELGWTTLGTGACVASANIINQWIEAPFDSQMSRTRNRVLVRFAVSPMHAFTLGIGSGLLGVGLLYQMVNPITALLGGLNILL